MKRRSLVRRLSKKEQTKQALTALVVLTLRSILVTIALDINEIIR